MTIEKLKGQPFDRISIDVVSFKWEKGDHKALTIQDDLTKYLKFIYIYITGR